MKGLRTRDPLVNQDFLDDLQEQITALGYFPDEMDHVLLCHQIDRAVERLANRINDSTIPAELRQYLLEQVLAEFYTTKVLTQSLPADFQFEQAIKTLREDDVTIEFKNDRFADQASFLASLEKIRDREMDWLCYRKIKW